jgi:hypothetical protein
MLLSSNFCIEAVRMLLIHRNGYHEPVSTAKTTRKEYGEARDRYSAIVLGVVWIPIIVVVFLTVGHAAGLIEGAVVLILVGLCFLLSKSYWNKVEAEKERTSSLKDLPSELDSPSSENL